MIKILQNQVKCLRCGDTPYSAHRHDFVECSCGAVAVDGGTNYLRRIGSICQMEELSVSVDDKVYKQLVEALDWAEETKRNELGIICAIFRVLRDNGYDLQTPLEREDD